MADTMAAFADRVRAREWLGDTGQPITIHFENADLVDVLFFFAEITGMNLVVHPDVTGKVTVHLTNVPWDQALDVILKMYNLHVMIE